MVRGSGSTVTVEKVARSVSADQGNMRVGAVTAGA